MTDSKINSLFSININILPSTKVPHETPTKGHKMLSIYLSFRLSNDFNDSTLFTWQT